MFESNTGERTVYAKSSLPHQPELAELEQQKRWVDIFQARQHNPELNELCEQVEIFYELSQRPS